MIGKRLHANKARPNKARTERGTALIEFSLVAGLLMYFIYAIAAFGLILSQKNSLTQAAAEGARSALTVADLPASTLDARQKAQAASAVASTLSWLGSKYQASDTTTNIAPCTTAPGDTSRCITVTINYPYSSRPLLPQAPGLGLITPNQIKATSVLRLS